MACTRVLHPAISLHRGGSAIEFWQPIQREPCRDIPWGSLKRLGHPDARWALGGHEAHSTPKSHWAAQSDPLLERGGVKKVASCTGGPSCPVIRPQARRAGSGHPRRAGTGWATAVHHAILPPRSKWTVLPSQALGLSDRNTTGLVTFLGTDRREPC